jgi:TolB-like protein
VARLLRRQREERFTTGADVIAALRAQQTPAAPVVSPAAKVKSDASIVVLPFANLGADPDNEYFSDGLTEEIITDLGGVKALRVISRTSSMQMKGTSKGMREIGSALGVR